MARTGIARIDQLFEGQQLGPIAPGKPDQDAVGVIQDFLRGHGFNELPGIRDQARGQFGPKTTEAVRAFRKSKGLQELDIVDRQTL